MIAVESKFVQADVQKSVKYFRKLLSKLSENFLSNEVSPTVTRASSSSTGRC